MGEIDLTERIRRRAYEIWDCEGRPHGMDQVHWSRAEAEIRGGVRARRPKEKSAKPTASAPPKKAPSPKPPSRSSQKPKG